MKINVTAEDIVQGSPRAPCHCPVARAIRRALGIERVTDVRVDGFIPIIRGESTSRLPWPVCTWIQAYDRTGRGKSLSFELAYVAPRQSWIEAYERRLAFLASPDQVKAEIARLVEVAR